MSKKVKMMNADIAIDGRGELLFCNNFNMSNIKRFYQISMVHSGKKLEKHPLTKSMLNETDISPSELPLLG